MAAVSVSPEARKDLIAIRKYILEQLNNPQAAARVIRELRRAVEGLAAFPGRGRPLDALIPVHTDYRYIPCEHYCIFYLESEESVLVVRILHERQDCMRALLGAPLVEEKND